VAGALVAGIGWIGMYVGIAYFLGEEIAHAVDAAGTKALIGVIALVVIGLTLRATYSRWRAARQQQPA
jgi:membrane protein DedA with SNARE-associated domain